ncbi:hypothetical protein ACPA9J_04520 [Pseudomonas aeruginosa]
MLRRCTRPPPRRITARGYSPYAPVGPGSRRAHDANGVSADTATSATADNRTRLFAPTPQWSPFRRAHNASGVIRRHYRHFPPRRITCRGYSPTLIGPDLRRERMTPTALSTDTAISATADNRKRLFALRPRWSGSRRAA